MTASQQRRGWMGLAFAAAAFALLVTLIPQQDRIAARAAASMTMSAGSATHSSSGRWTSWEWPALSHATGADYVSWTAILPVLFVGLMAPLTLVCARLVFADSRRPLAPALPSKFQRPPPQLA